MHTYISLLSHWKYKNFQVNAKSIDVTDVDTFPYTERPVLLKHGSENNFIWTIKIIM